MRQSKEKFRKKLIALVHIGKKELGLDDSTYKFLLLGTVGKQSCQEMTLAELWRVVDFMVKKGFKIVESSKLKGESKPYDELDDRPGMASPEQLRTIEMLWAQITNSPDFEKSLRKIVFKIAKVSDLKFLTLEGATKTIGALKKIRKIKDARERSDI